jgi:hypothetical protein
VSVCRHRLAIISRIGWIVGNGEFDAAADGRAPLP